jgi:MFS-type transporter involved in bile tolerance (Atg22 family)
VWSRHVDETLADQMKSPRKFWINRLLNLTKVALLGFLLGAGIVAQLGAWIQGDYRKGVGPNSGIWGAILGAILVPLLWWFFRGRKED